MSEFTVPYMQIRGGSSKGLFFAAEDLPQDLGTRDEYILGAMEGVGRGDPRQIDGLGGANSLTSKAAVVSKSQKEGVDLDYLFVQVVVGEGRISSSQNCGNILAGVLPYAIEKGLLPATHPTTTAKIQMVNSGGFCLVTVQTPKGQLVTRGDVVVDGVPGRGAPIICSYLDTAGMNCGSLFPTGKQIDVIDGLEVTCIDNGMPVVHLRAKDLGLTGYETKKKLDADVVLKKRLNRIRLKIGPKMDLGDVSNKTVPKMCVIAPARQRGLINTRTFIPHQCHPTIGVLSAFSTAAAGIIPGTIANGISNIPEDLASLSIEHPAGQFTVGLEIRAESNEFRILKSTAIRTARIISKGQVFIPRRG